MTSTGLASGLSEGTSTMSATLDGVAGSTVLDGDPRSPRNDHGHSRQPTVSKGETESFMAMGMYSDDSTVDLTSQVTWASSKPSVATISNDSGTQGVATAVDNGTSTISASLNGITRSTTMTVSTSDLNPVAVRDNGQAGYYQYGIWNVAAGGLNGTYSSADPATSSSASARWLLKVPQALTTYGRRGRVGPRTRQMRPSRSTTDSPIWVQPLRISKPLPPAANTAESRGHARYIHRVQWKDHGGPECKWGERKHRSRRHPTRLEHGHAGIGHGCPAPATTQATGSSIMSASDPMTDMRSTTQSSLPGQPDPKAQVTISATK